MHDLPGMVALVVVVVGLAMTALAQVRPLHRGRALCDLLAIIPEWRFYAQASLRTATDLGRDTHLVVRDRDAASGVGGWRPVLWHAERRLRHSLWNPALRVDVAILSAGEDLAEANEIAAVIGDRRTGVACRAGTNVQQSIRYLVLLRHVLEVPPTPVASVDRQFAIVHTIGRGARTMSIDFLSAWHRC